MDEIVFCPSCMAQNSNGYKVCRKCGGSLKKRNAAHQLPVETILHGRYLVGLSIGEGGFGITYVGLDLLLKVKIAVKEYFPQGAANRSFNGRIIPNDTGTDLSFTNGKERFLKEAKALSLFIDEPNIVTLRDYFEENNTAYIVMEFLDGIDLREFSAENGKTGFEQAYNLLRPVMLSLSKIHSKNLIHRDVSPSNLMLLSDGNVKLLDFGASIEKNEKRGQNDTLMLKPGYAPVEQYMSGGAQGAWTDVYAVCATIYFLITGTAPETSVDRAYNDTLIPPRKLKADITAAEESVLMKGLAIEKNDRIQSMDDLIRLLDASLKGKGISSGGRRSLIPIAAVLVIAAAVILGAVSGMERPKPSPAPAVGETSAPDQADKEEASSSVSAERPVISALPVPIVTLSPDAYEAPILSGMKEIEGFSEQVALNENGIRVTAVRALLGNHHLMIIAKTENSNRYSVDSIGGYLKLLDDSWGMYFYDKENLHQSGRTLEANSSAYISYYLNLDEAYMEVSSLKERGAYGFSEIGVDFNYYLNGEYTSLDGKISLPERITLSSPLAGYEEEIFRNEWISVSCGGLQLNKDHFCGELFLNYTAFALPSYYSGNGEVDYNDYQRFSVDFDSVYADGKKISNQQSGYNGFSVSDYTYFLNEKQSEVAIVNYAYSTQTDSMNIMHSGKKLPKEMSLQMTLGKDGYKKDPVVVKLKFSIDDDGYGTLSGIEHN